MCLGVLIYWIDKKDAGPLIRLSCSGYRRGPGLRRSNLAADTLASRLCCGLLTWTVNELLFPVGCSFILYASTAVSKKLEPSSE